MAPNKPHAQKTADATARNKARYLKALEDGMRPYLAAKRCHLAHSTVYAWKAADPEFDKAWQEAHAIGLDKLELDVYRSGRRGNASNAQFYLKARRPEVFGQRDPDEHRTINGNVILNVTPQEHEERLARLGLTAPLMIETDFEEDDVAVPPGPRGDDSSSST